MRLRDNVCDWIGFVFCEAAFRLMPDDFLVRCIFRAFGESHAEIDEYVDLMNYSDYRYYDHAFFMVGSALYRIGCLFYAKGKTSGTMLIIPGRFEETDTDDTGDNA